jgi:hypothetical protein
MSTTQEAVEVVLSPVNDQMSHVTNTYRVEINSFNEDSSTTESSEEFVEISDEDGKIVHWPPPPKEGEFVQKLESNISSAVSSSAKYSKFNCNNDNNATSQQMDNPRTTALASELFKPGKLKADDRWKPAETIQQENQEEHQQVKRKFKTMDEVMQSHTEPAKHRTYHIPPGTTRTRRAQDNYTKHLKPQE